MGLKRVRSGLPECWATEMQNVMFCCFPVCNNNQLVMGHTSWRCAEMSMSNETWRAYWLFIWFQVSRWRQQWSVTLRTVCLLCILIMLLEAWLISTLLWCWSINNVLWFTCKAKSWHVTVSRGGFWMREQSSVQRRMQIKQDWSESNVAPIWAQVLLSTHLQSVTTIEHF